MDGPLHADELALDEAVISRLLATQFPELADEPITPLSASGSSNRLYRLGAERLLRFPRQPGGGGSIEREARWLPLIASHLPVPVPTMLEVDVPGEGHTEAWAVVRWLPGTRASA
ncbi:MAG: phosphotransferase, partial [Pseudomonadales bacterium]|nr:phosphotransferase [Pseudomonadales bacterium]